VHSTDEHGIFCLLDEAGDFATEATKLASANADPSELTHSFKWPGGSVLTYDVSTKKREWVMISADGKPLDRDHRTWPLMTGDVPGYQIASPPSGNRVR
jgi:hypothetical protein